MSQGNLKAGGQRGLHPAARIKKILGWASVFIASVLAVYVGIWLMLAEPLIRLYLTYQAGELTVLLTAVTLVECWLSLTVGGLIWSVGYMIKCMLD